MNEKFHVRLGFNNKTAERNTVFFYFLNQKLERAPYLH